MYGIDYVIIFPHEMLHQLMQCFIRCQGLRRIIHTRHLTKNLSGGFPVSECKGLGCGRAASAESLPQTAPPGRADPPIPRGYRVGPRRPPQDGGPAAAPCRSSCRVTIAAILQASCKPRPLKRRKTSQKSCSAKSFISRNQAISSFFALQRFARRLYTAGGRLCSGIQRENAGSAAAVRRPDLRHPLNLDRDRLVVLAHDRRAVAL